MPLPNLQNNIFPKCYLMEHAPSIQKFELSHMFCVRTAPVMPILTEPNFELPILVQLHPLLNALIFMLLFKPFDLCDPVISLQLSAGLSENTFEIFHVVCVLTAPLGSVVSHGLHFWWMSLYVSDEVLVCVSLLGISDRSTDLFWMLSICRGPEVVKWMILWKTVGNIKARNREAIQRGRSSKCYWEALYSWIKAFAHLFTG